MNQVQKSIKPLVSGAEKFLNRGLDNVYINTAIKVFLALYAALAAPQLPPVVAGLLDNLVGRALFAFVIVFVALRDAGIALMLAVAYIVTLQTVNKMNLINSSLSTSAPGELSWLPSAKTALDFFKELFSGKKTLETYEEKEEFSGPIKTATERFSAILAKLPILK